MKFKTSREEALDQFNSFIDYDILIFNSKRSFDYGVDISINVSCL